MVFGGYDEPQRRPRPKFAKRKQQMLYKHQ